MEKSYGIAGLMFLLLFACSSQPKVSFDSVSFKVELALTHDEMAKGLMFRESLPSDRGMLFVFDDEKPRTFWMKNTLIPLDMIFMDGNMTVVHVAEAYPCEVDPCETYSSPPAMYVLEVNKGLSKENNIVIGSRAYLS